MTHQELRRKFIDFYRAHGHSEIPQASLVPLQDASVLFTTAGMHPLIPYLLGEKHPDGTRLVNIQRSLRTTDIEQVGDATHATFFEMLGHWSLGDYGKREAIEWSFEFVTSALGFPVERLAATIFAGDSAKRIGLDQDAQRIWQKLGVTRIVSLKEDNWWGPVHVTGPCGPTTEIFVHIYSEQCGVECQPGSATDDHWVEIWNNVFMEYNKVAENRFEPLKQKNIDTGVGLERVLMTVNGLESIYETDLYQPTIAAISTLQGASDNRTVRVLADHMRAAVFLVADGVLPSNKDRGYVLRRLIRRAVQAARQLEFTDWPLLIEAVISTYADSYPHLTRVSIQDVILAEQQHFSVQLERATRFLEKEAPKQTPLGSEGAAKLAFLAYQSHALPPELGYEILVANGLTPNRVAFNQAFDNLLTAHRQVSSAGFEKKFGGHGLILDTGELRAGNKEELNRVLRLHTATHLTQAALRHVLGAHVQQKGSDINPERLRFDFTHAEKLSPEQIRNIESWVNGVIAQDLPVQVVELPLDEAKKSGALHFFTHRYPDQVKVYFIGRTLGEAISKEFCGGPHVAQTGQIGQFKILKEQSASAGVRRIKASVE
ncbi:alanine--tRNA ligase [Candidatus Berkelbacteria bacterium]|nr:alanine--tRNA ligase [Candidatus Berkelbacteria bacterium]